MKKGGGGLVDSLFLGELGPCCLFIPFPPQQYIRDAYQNSNFKQPNLSIAKHLAGIANATYLLPETSIPRKYFFFSPFGSN